MATIEADSCSYAHVSAAVTAASNGDTVLVPSGSATWETMLSIGKGIYLIADGCTITNGISASWPSEFLITYNPTDYSLNQPFRLNGFNFDAAGSYVILLGSGSKAAPFTINNQVRIDHNSFANSGSSIKGQFIYNNGSLYGVVDSNTFTGSGYPVAHSGGGDGESNENWWNHSPQNLFELGGAYYLYFEDNTFTLAADGGNVVTDGEYCARYAFRYNTITAAWDTYSMFDIHGTQTTPMGACFGAELYGNNISHGSYTLIFLKQRSGQCLVFMNNATGSSAPLNRAYTSTACVCPDNCTDKVTHNTYHFRNLQNMSGAQWDSDALGGLDCCELTDIPTMGRDVFSESSSPGVSVGTLANIPETCSVGQGYWATSQDTSDLTNFVGANPTTPISGSLYVCFSENVWTNFYTPYTYPHPLRAGTSLAKQSVRVRF